MFIKLSLHLLVINAICYGNITKMNKFMDQIYVPNIQNYGNYSIILFTNFLMEHIIYYGYFNSMNHLNQ